MFRCLFICIFNNSRIEEEGGKFWRKPGGGRCGKGRRGKRKRGNDVMHFYVLIQCLRKILLKKSQCWSEPREGRR